LCNRSTSARAVSTSSFGRFVAERHRRLRVHRSFVSRRSKRAGTHPRCPTTRRAAVDRDYDGVCARVRRHTFLPRLKYDDTLSDSCSIHCSFSTPHLVAEPARRQQRHGCGLLLLLLLLLARLRVRRGGARGLLRRLVRVRERDLGRGVQLRRELGGRGGGGGGQRVDDSQGVS
jgi:hypothetical protein